MTDTRYTIGLDFGSLSCRGVLTDVRDGHVVAEAAMNYPHAVMDTALPDGTPIPGGWCLQHPGEFVETMTHVVRTLATTEGVKPEQIIGLCADCTTSTVMPVDDQLQPLCFDPAYASRPHAWLKMWKHHGATRQAQRLNEVCREQNRPYLDWYGGKINPECLLAKVMQVFDEDRAVYDAAHLFMEIGDYLPTLLTGKPVFAKSILAAKAFWCEESGYPDGDFFAAFDPALRRLPDEKLMNRRADRIVAAPGAYVGGLLPEIAEQLGLQPGIAVGASQMDAYTPMLGLGIAEPGVMLLVIGTSTGVMLLGDRERPVEGVTVSRPDTYYPSLWGYGSGQASVGDGFQWFSENCVPAAYTAAAQEKGVSIQQYLTELAASYAPGKTGVIALDWINGNKSCLGNSRLSGMFLGLNLNTKPEHIYRAMLEATAFGARMIVEAYTSAGVPVNEIRVCGGIANKNPLMMQIYADVLNMPLKVSRNTQAPALGSAIYAARAAGAYDTIFDAVNAMADRTCTVYTPDAQHTAAYEELYQEYKTLHDYFGRGGNKVMERLYEKRNYEL